MIRVAKRILSNFIRVIYIYKLASKFTPLTVIDYIFSNVGRISRTAVQLTSGRRSLGLE